MGVVRDLMGIGTGSSPKGSDSSDSGGSTKPLDTVKRLFKKRPDNQSDSFSPAGVDSYKRGGKVKRTGLARVHKGERVLTKKQQRALKRKGKLRD